MRPSLWPSRLAIEILYSKMPYIKRLDEHKVIVSTGPLCDHMSINPQKLYTYLESCRDDLHVISSYERESGYIIITLKDRPTPNAR